MFAALIFKVLILSFIIYNLSVQVESLSAKKHLLGNLKPKKKNEIEQMGLLNKKIKILGDGINVSLHLNCDICSVRLNVQYSCIVGYNLLICMLPSDLICYVQSILLSCLTFIGFFKLATDAAIIRNL